MKKTVFIFMLFAFGTIFSQEHTKADTTNVDNTSKEIYLRKNEIHLGVVKLLTGVAVDVNYERIIDVSSSYGATLILGTHDFSDIYTQKFNIGGFYRMYFTEDKQYGSKGFFAEGFTSYVSGEKITEYHSYYGNNNTYYKKQKDYNLVAIGLGLGKKWVNKKGFIFQLFGGLGRSVIKNEYAPDFIGRLDAYIGYRF